MKFTKMHGIGNDYIYINTFEEHIADPHSLAQRLSHRNFGIGSDGLVLITPPGVAFQAAQAAATATGEVIPLGHVGMRMFNPDGSESAMCGNAIRCVGKYVYDTGMCRETHLRVETASGLKKLELFLDKGNPPQVESVRVDMGNPQLNPVSIPLSLAAYTGNHVAPPYTEAHSFVGRTLTLAGLRFKVTAISMGNPHAVIFLNEVGAEKTTAKEDCTTCQPVPTLANFPLSYLGPLFENHPLFPRRTNVEFVEIVDRGRIRMRVWERGAGETLACGTGACAAVVAGVLNGFIDRTVTVELTGGELEIVWDAASEHVFMKGGASVVFTGEIQV